MTKPLKTLARIERDLDRTAGTLEDAGLDRQRDKLDRAADIVQEVKDSLEMLKAGV